MILSFARARKKVLHDLVGRFDSYPEIIPQAEEAKQGLKRNYIVIKWGLRPHPISMYFGFNACLAFSALGMILGYESNLLN